LKKIAIIGAGPAGLIAAMELMDSAEIDLYERGLSLEDRLKEVPINATCGIGGAGCMSDGKLTLHPQVGTSQVFLNIFGQNYIDKRLSELHHIFLDILGQTDIKIKTSEYSEEFKQKCRQAGFSLINKSAVAHYGTENARDIIKNIISIIKNKVNIFCEANILPNFVFKSNKIELNITIKESSITKEYDYIILATGRSGALWMRDLYENSNLPFVPGIVDIGVRVECIKDIFEHFYEHYAFDPKFSRLSSFGERTRNFCSCLNNGEVTLEEYKFITDHNNNPLVCVNGHSYSEDYKNENPSGNSNMAILVSCKFTQPFSDPIGYAQSIGKLVNTLADGGVFLQSYLDFKKQRRSKEDRIKKIETVPSLQDNWVAGDISFALPHRIVKAIEEFIDGMDILFPGFANTLLMYAPEAKLYSNQALIDEKELFYCGHENIYPAGDCSGLTRSWSTASLHGLVIAERIKQNI
jgi:uncharacterized FAD-dependent dehydrogenase